MSELTIDKRDVERPLTDLELSSLLRDAAKWSERHAWFYGGVAQIDFSATIFMRSDAATTPLPDLFSGHVYPATFTARGTVQRMLFNRLIATGPAGCIWIFEEIRSVLLDIPGIRFHYAHHLDGPIYFLEKESASYEVATMVQSFFFTPTIASKSAGINAAAALASIQAFYANVLDNDTFVYLARK